MKNTLSIVYLTMGVIICSWFTVAAVYRWKSPDFGIAKSFNNSGSGGSYYGGSYGRSSGGSWGGGK